MGTAVWKPYPWRSKYRWGRYILTDEGFYIISRQRNSNRVAKAVVFQFPDQILLVWWLSSQLLQIVNMEPPEQSRWGCAARTKIKSSKTNSYHSSHTLYQVQERTRHAHCPVLLSCMHAWEWIAGPVMESVNTASRWDNQGHLVCWLL